jgi:glycosyltransferase involved in cell wall biosynthesis
VEILIADGMSDDETLTIIRSMPASERVRVIPNPERIQVTGLNRAVQAARGDIIVRVDGHTIIAPDYVRQCVQTLEITGADNVGGAMNPVGVTPIGRAIAAAGKSPFAVPTAFHVSTQAQDTDTVYLGAWRRELFDRIGLFDPRFKTNEDYEFNYRIRKAGGFIRLTPTIQSHYIGRQTIQALSAQYFRYGVGKVRTLKEHPRSLRLRHLVAPLFVAGLLIGAVLALLHPVFFALWLSGIGLYALANIAASAAAARGDLNLLWRLPVIFLTIHLSWGAGFWVGIVHSLRGQ